MQINVLEYFLKTAEQWPSKLAIADGQQEWSFAKLKQRAGAIARQIVTRTETTNQPIAVYLPKTNEAISSFLGVLFSGNCYAPLDVKAPVGRIHAIISHLEPILILTTSKLGAQLLSAGTDPRQLLILEEIPDDEARIPERWQKRIDTDPVYIIHTSGSTGKPKGVVVTHRGVIDYIDWA